GRRGRRRLGRLLGRLGGGRLGSGGLGGSGCVGRLHGGVAIGGRLVGGRGRGRGWRRGTPDRRRRRALGSWLGAGRRGGGGGRAELPPHEQHAGQGEGAEEQHRLVAALVALFAFAPPRGER